MFTTNKFREVNKIAVKYQKYFGLCKMILPLLLANFTIIILRCVKKTMSKN